MSKAYGITINSVDSVSFVLSYPIAYGNPNVYKVTMRFSFMCTDSNSKIVFIEGKEFKDDYLLINASSTKPTIEQVSTALNSSKAAIDLYIAQMVYDISGNLMTGYTQTGGVVRLI
jgi:hypothetical protein